MEERISMKIGERGQVTIPKTLREKYGLLPNIEAGSNSSRFLDWGSCTV